jgi:hypothetical protein
LSDCCDTSIDPQLQRSHRRRVIAGEVRDGRHVLSHPAGRRPQSDGQRSLIAVVVRVWVCQQHDQHSSLHGWHAFVPHGGIAVRRLLICSIEIKLKLNRHGRSVSDLPFRDSEGDGL